MFVITDVHKTRNRQRGRERDKTTAGQMSHPSLCPQKVDAYMFGTHEKQAYRPQRRVLVGLLWSGRFCFVTVKVQLSGGKQTQSTLPFSLIRSGSSSSGELHLFVLSQPETDLSTKNASGSNDGILDLSMKSMNMSILY